MALSEPEWKSIATMIQREITAASTRRAFFVTCQVLKVDKDKKLIWTKEFGDQAIPIVAFDYKVFYYDETPRGVNTTSVGSAAQHKTFKKTAKIELVMPKAGDFVLVARELGLDRIPRALGVIMGTDWNIPEDE